MAFMITYPVPKFLQNIDFHESLLVKPLFVSNDLDGNQASSLMVHAADNLPKTSLSKNIYNFISVSKMITIDNVVVSSLIVITKIGLFRLNVTNHLLSTLSAAEVDIFEVYNLTPLEDIEAGSFKRDSW